MKIYRKYNKTLNMKNKITLLDCTLRDGGYYNNWNFSLPVIENYLSSMSESKIDYVEIGFRFLKKNTNYGFLAFTREANIKKIKIPKNLKIAVMINGNEYVDNLDKLRKIFVEKNKSKIDLVRVAINIQDVEKVEKITKALKLLKYKVAINLMQSNNVKKNFLINLINKLSHWNSCDILYFADSLGAMDHLEVKRLCLIINKHWNKKFGFHSHDNRSLSLSNSLEAVKNSADFIDSTILGMGRGAGNLATEKIIFELNKLNIHSGKVNELSNCIEDFKNLQKKYLWGSNIFYHYAALNNIHPTYIQTLLLDKRYNNKQIFDSIDFLSKNKSSSFDYSKMMNSIYKLEKEKIGSWNAFQWVSNEKVLIIGSGPSLIKNKLKVINFINKHKPKVIFLNINKIFDEKIATATIACHEARILGDLKMYQNLKNPLIIPYSNLNQSIKKTLNKKKVLDYSLTLKDNTFEINQRGCILKWPLAIAYALSVVTIGNPKIIYLAGFDGYQNKYDDRQVKMNEFFNLYKKIPNKAKLSILTKSTYNIK